MADCETCQRTFGSQRAAHQHMNAVGHWACESCTDEFYRQEDAEDHMDYYDHRVPRFECETCNDRFYSEEDAEDHMDDYGHRLPPFECEACNDRFYSSQSARTHMDQTNHWRKHWCSSCRRGFQNENNLRMHMTSSIHRGTPLSCPFCKRAFTTATGVTTHLESGSCPNATSLNHATILQEIRKRDPNHLITKKLLTYPTSTSSITATAAAWNGYCYECYLCHRGFGSLTALNQHVNSPAHVSKDKVYHCPGRGCPREFSRLASLFNHLESETCGAVKFESVQRNVEGFLTGKRLIGFN